MKIGERQTKVLLIDNKLENWHSLWQILAPIDYQIVRVSAQDVENNLALEFVPDVILLDISIAELKLMKIWQESRNYLSLLKIPIILLISLEEISVALNEVKLDFADYIIKPLRHKEVLIRVKNQVKIQRLRQQLIAEQQKSQQLTLELAKHKQLAYSICHTETSDICPQNYGEQELVNQLTSTLKLCNYNSVLSQLGKHQALSQGQLPAAFSEITEAGAKNIGVERASIWLYKTTTNQLQCLDLFEQSSHQHSVGLNLSATEYPTYFQAWQQNEAIAADHACVDSRTQELAPTYFNRFGITSILCIPIRLGGKTIGVFCLEAVATEHHWTQEEQNFARSLGNLVSLVLEARERQKAEAAHRASEQKLASAFRASPDPIALCTFPDTQYIEVNDSFCRFFGYTRTQVIGHTNTELNIWVNSQDRDFLCQILRQTQTIRNYEVDFCTSNGEIKTVLLSAEMIDIEGQKYVLATAKDITERKQAETESRLLLLTTQAIARAVDVKSALTLVLRLICQTIGWDFGEAWIPNDDGSVLEHSLVCYCEDKRLEEFCDRNHLLTFTSGVGLPGRVWQKKQPEWIEDISQVNHSVFLRSSQAAKIGFKAGFGVPILAGREVVAVLVFFKRSSMSVDKRLLMLVGTVATQLGSLIQQQMIETAHRKSEERLQLALEASELGLWDWHLATGKIYRDWQWQNILGYSESEVDQHQLINNQLIHPEDLPAVTSALNAHLQGETAVYEMEFRMRCASGTWKWIHVRGQVVERDSQGNPVRMTGTNKDITDRKTLEKQLQLREARLNAFFSGAPVGMNILDHQMRCVQINELMAEIYGQPQQELIGKTLQEIAPQIDPLVTPFCQQVLLTGETILNRELSIATSATPDNLRHFLVSYFPIPGEDNCPSGVGTVMLEISGLKRAEAALRESIERERAIAQVIQGMRQTLDLETIFTSTTAELRQVLNCDRVVVYRFQDDWKGEFVAESVGAGWRSLLDLHEQNPNLTQDTLENGRCILKMLDGQQTPLQDQFITANVGTSFCCVQNIHQADFHPDYIKFLERLQAKAYITVPILCGNQVWGLLASYQNSNPRQWKTGEINIVVQIGNQLGVALQQAQLLSQTQQQSQALQAAVTAADNANKAKSEFLANMSHELRTPLNAILGFTQLMSHDKGISLEHQQNLGIINRAGEHLLNLINDILEMSKIEAGKTTLNLTNFDLIHLLKNVQEMLQIRAKPKGLQLIFEYSPNLPQYIHTDESKLRQVLLNIVGNAIKFTTSGSVKLRVKLGNLGSKGHGDWRYRSRSVGENNLSLVAAFAPLAESYVGVTENARSSGKPTSQVIDRKSPNLNHAHLIFEVEDTGQGIAPQELNLLFEAFGQTESGRRSQQGTGLGLAISRKYVQMMGGEINVTSSLGIGSQFTFDIQVDVISAVDLPRSSVSRWVTGLVPQPNQEQYRILVVDDIPDSRILLVKLLSSIGFAVQEASNGQEAVALWEQWHPHLIFMDMRMPVMDGYQATRLIRQRELEHREKCHMMSMAKVGAKITETYWQLAKCVHTASRQEHRVTTAQSLLSHTIIIALTANVFEEQRDAMLKAGCDDLINKPFPKAQILDKLSQYLGVNYLYQDDLHHTCNIKHKSLEKVSTKDELLMLLSKMSPEWLKKIYQAAAQGSDELILDLIKQMPSDSNVIKDYFSCLANNFQFEKIMELTK